MLALIKKHVILIAFCYNAPNRKIGCIFMKKISIVDYVKIDLSGRLHNVLELGSGDLAEATQIAAEISGEYFAIDKRAVNARTSAHVTFINADYFDIDTVDNIIHDKKFDLIFANYSLCFNKKDALIERLPHYFDKLTENGIFYVGDFTTDEEIVKKRTNLDDEWFFDLIKKYFSSFEILRQEVYEEVHGHTHKIFEVIAQNKITS